MTTAEEQFIESILSDDENFPIYGELPQVKIDGIKGEAERKAMLRAILAFSKFRASVADTLVDVWAEAGKPALLPYDIKDVKGRCMSHIAPTQEEIDSWDGKSTPRFVKDMIKLDSVALTALTKDIDRLCECQQNPDEDLVGLVFKGERGNNLESTVRFVQRLKEIGTPDWCIISIASFEWRMIQINSFISHMLLFFMDEQAVRMVLGIGAQNASRSTQMFARTLAGCDNELSLKVEKLERAIADSALSFSETLRTQKAESKAEVDKVKADSEKEIEKLIIENKTIKGELVQDDEWAGYELCCKAGLMVKLAEPIEGRRYRFAYLTRDGDPLAMCHACRDLIKANMGKYTYVHQFTKDELKDNVLSPYGKIMSDSNLRCYWLFS